MNKFKLLHNKVPDGHTLAYLNALFGGADSGNIFLRLIHGKTNVAYNKARPLPLGQVNLQTLQKFSDDGYNLYIGMAVRGDAKNDNGNVSGSRSNVLSCNVLWCDIDNTTQSWQDLLFVDNPLPPPNMVIRSGGGFHAYWFLSEKYTFVGVDTIAQFERVLGGFSCVFGGDKQVCQIQSTLRLPGFVNRKEKYADNPPMVDIVYYDGQESRYDFWNLRATYGNYAPAPAFVLPPIKFDDDKKPKSYPPSVQEFLSGGVGEGSRNKALYLAAAGLLNMGFTESEAQGILTSAAIGYGLIPREVDTTIRSAFKSNPLPTGSQVATSLLNAVAVTTEILRG